MKTFSKFTLVVSILLYITGILHLNAKPLVDYSLEMRKMPGEQLPVLHNRSIVKNWSFKNDFRDWTPNAKNAVEIVKIKNKKAAKLITRNSKDKSVLLSAPIKVTPRKKYLFTYVYQTKNAKFSSFSKCWPVVSSAQELFAPRRFGYLGGYKTINRKTGEWQRFARIYTPRTDTIRIAITLSGAPAEVIFDDIYFAPFEKDSRAGNFSWGKYLSDLAPSMDKNKVDSILHKRLNSTAKIKMQNGSPVIFLDGKAYPSLIYVGDHFQPYRMRETAFQKAGIKLQTIFLNNRIHQMWEGENDYNFQLIDKQIWEIVNRNPAGYYIIGIDVSPYKNWSKDFPDEVAKKIDGNITTDRHGNKAPPSYWSEIYRKQVYKYLHTIITHMKKQRYFKTIVGFHILGNDDYQFYYQINRGTLQDGSSYCDFPAFRSWLKKRYNNNLEKLRQSWKNPVVTFATAKPLPDKKNATNVFYNASESTIKRDYVAFLNESMGQFANKMCLTTQQAAGKQVIAGMWWGRGANCGVYPQFAQTKVVLPNDNIQFMGAQAGYWGVRENGNECIIPAVFDSTRIHKKVTMLEIDFRTWVGRRLSMPHDFQVVRFWNLYDLKGAMLRDFGKMFSVGGGIWWFDMSSVFFHDPHIMKLIKEIKKAAVTLNSNPGKSFTPAEIVFIADEQNYYRTTEQTNVWNGPNYHTIRINQRAVTRAGIKFDFYYFNDILNKNMVDYKVYVFMNTFYLSPRKRRFIEEKLKKNNKLIIWLYAPGYLTDNGQSIQAMEKLTGFKFDKKISQLEDAFFCEHHKNPLLTGIQGNKTGIGVLMKGPAYAVKDNTAESLAYYRNSHKTAVALKKMNGWKSLFIGPPSGLTPKLLKNICKYAGIHVYNETPGDLFMYHRDDLICIHGVEGNLNQIRLPFNAQIKDLMTDKILKENAKNLDIRLLPGETRLFLIKKTNKLSP